LSTGKRTSKTQDNSNSADCERMQPVQQELSKTYAGMSEGELALLHAQINSLTDVARDALAVEVHRRGLSAAELSKLYHYQLRDKAKFDRRQKEHREQLAYILLAGRLRWFLGGRPKLATIISLALLGLLLILKLLSHHR